MREMYDVRCKRAGGCRLSSFYQEFENWRIMEISKTMLIQLRGLLNTAGKDLMEIGQRPHCGWAYHEWKAKECLKMSKRIDKLIKIR